MGKPKKGAVEAEPAAEVAKEGEVEVKITIECLLGSGSSVAQPSLRFSWLGATKVDTGKVGDSASGWETPEPEPVEAEEGKEAPVPPPQPSTFTRSLGGLAPDLETAKNLNAHGVMWVFVSHNPEEGKVDPYAASIPVDVSGLLDGETDVTIELRRNTLNAGDLDNRDVFLAPEGFEYLRISVTTPDVWMTDEMRVALNPLSLSVKSVVGLPGVHLAEGDPSLERFVTPTPYHLIDKYCKPMYVTFQFYDGQGLPRVVVTPTIRAGPQGRLHHKTVFLAGEDVMNADLVKEWFVTRPCNIEVHDRDRDDSRVPEVAEQRAKWRGLVDGTWKPPPPPEGVDVSDIDPDAWRPPSLEFRPPTRRLRSRGGGGAGGDDGEGGEGKGDDDVPESRTAPATARSGPGTARGSRLPTAREGAGGPVVQLGQENDVFDVDKEIAIREIERGFVTAGDKYPHGVARLRLEPLLDRSRERLALIRQREAARVALEAERRQKAMTKEEERAARRRAAREAAAEKKRIAKERADRHARGEFTPRPEDEEGEDGEGKTEGDGGDGGDGAAGDGDGGGDETKEPSAAPTAPPTHRSTRDIEEPEPPISSLLPAPKWEPRAGHDPISIFGSIDITTTQRRVIPKGGDMDFDVPEEERVTRLPGAYAVTGGRVKYTAALRRPMYTTPPTEAPPKLQFERAVYIMRYNEDEMLKEVLSVITDVNKAALPHAASVRSHALDAEEYSLAEQGTLDVISGFQVVDDNWRILVVEGLGDGAMKTLHQRVVRNVPNSPTLLRLANPEVRFYHREYTHFNIAPKDIRLREPLASVMKNPDLYNRAKVSATCFEALQRLFELRRQSRLAIVKAQSLFPTVEMLLELENKYGDTVTIEDMNGSKPRSPPGSRVPSRGKSVATGSVGGSSVGDGLDASSTVRREPLKAALDMGNDAYEEMLKERATVRKNFLATNKDLVASRSKDVTMSRTLTSAGASIVAGNRDTVDLRALKGTMVYNYSGQKLQYSEQQKDLMMERLGKDKSRTYTFSPEYQSLAMPIVNEPKIEVQEKEASKKKWTTKRGFVYPPPKSKADFARHPHAPHAARADDLRDEWVDPTERYAPKLTESFYDKDGSRKPDFIARSKLGSTFGMVNADGKEDPEFFKSVHLSGGALEAEMEASKKKERDDWNAKVVVDSTRFEAYKPPSKPTQVDKIKSLLDGPVLSKSMRIIHKARLPSGKKTAAPVALPVSDHMATEWTTPVDFAAGLKPNDVTGFLGRSSTGMPVGFTTVVNSAHCRPQPQQVVYKRHHPPLTEEDKKDPRWTRK